MWDQNEFCDFGPRNVDSIEAFDLVSHELLGLKLQAMRFLLKWLTSYL